LKKSFIFIVIILLSVKLYPQTELSYGVEYVSRYIWRGFDSTPDNNPNIQSYINFSSKSGFNLNIWSSTPLSERKKLDNFFEIDLTLSYSRSLSRILDFNAGFIYYTFPHIKNFPDDKSTSPEIFAGIQNSLLPLNPNVTIYYDFNLGDGIYIQVSGSKKFINVPGNDFNLDVSVGYIEQYRVEGISDVNIGFSKVIELKSVIVVPRIVFTTIPENDVNPDGSELWFGLAINKK